MHITEAAKLYKKKISGTITRDEYLKLFAFIEKNCMRRDLLIDELEQQAKRIRDS